MERANLSNQRPMNASAHFSGAAGDVLVCVGGEQMSCPQTVGALRGRQSRAQLVALVPTASLSLHPAGDLLNGGTKEAQRIKTADAGLTALSAPFRRAPLAHREP